MCGYFVFSAVLETKCSHLKGIKGDGGMAVHLGNLGKMSCARNTQRLLSIRITLVQLKSGLPQYLHWKKPQSWEGLHARYIDISRASMQV